MWLLSRSISTIVITSLLFSVVLCEEEQGELCDVEVTRSNNTYIDRKWCEAGCCHDDDNQTVICCQPQDEVNGMIYGVLMVAVVVIVAVCMYVRVKWIIVTRKPPQQPPEQPDPDPGVQSNEAFAEDLPPPYWMCVSEEPQLPPYDAIAANTCPNPPNHLNPPEPYAGSAPFQPSTTTRDESSQTQSDEPQSPTAMIDVETTSCTTSSETSTTAIVSSSQQTTALSEGVILEPSSLVKSSISSST